jgi:8-oxo-dGTP pyrophosphatase MutT (NUDIX family)
MTPPDQPTPDQPTPDQPAWAALDALASTDDLGLARVWVEGFEPVEPIQAEHRATVLDFIDEHPDALHRSCLTGHLTGSAWVVDASGTRGLIMHHAKVQRWLQPGGHADGDANLAAVALREATEETGIDDLVVWTRPVDIDIHLFVNRSGAEPDHLHLDLRFVVQASAGATPVGNHESAALRWITENELDDPELALDASTKRVARHGFDLVRRKPSSVAL